MGRLQKPTSFMIGVLKDERCRDLVMERTGVAAKVWSCLCGSCDVRVYYARDQSGRVWFLANHAAIPVGATHVSPVLHGIESSEDLDEMISSPQNHPIDMEFLEDWLSRGLRAALLSCTTPTLLS